MFRWAIIFAVIALIASLFGFGGVAGMSKGLRSHSSRCRCNPRDCWIYFERKSLTFPDQFSIKREEPRFFSFSFENYLFYS